MQIAAPVVRSSFCANGVRGGARLFIYDMGGKFLIASRWQNVGYRKTLEAALTLFERTLAGA